MSNTNTEKAGGTRYSEGKVSHLWAPVRPVVLLNDYALELFNYRVQHPNFKLGPTEDVLINAAGIILSEDPWARAPITNAYFMTIAAWACLMPAMMSVESDPWGFCFGLKGMAKVTEFGSQKYAPHDWHVGQSLSSLLGSFSRHVFDSGILIRGGRCRWNDTDPESAVPHRYHAAWNLMVALQLIKMECRIDCDDVSPFVNKTTEEYGDALEEFRDMIEDLERQEQNDYYS